MSASATFLDALLETRRARWGIALLPSQVRYQLVLLARNPIVPFITIVIPLMLLVALDLVTPEMTLRSLGNIPVAQFLTPAMGSFAVLNAGFVNIVVGMTLGRERRSLKRFRTTPLPTWIYLTGRLCAAAIIAALSTGIVLAVGIVLLHAHLKTPAIGGLAETFVVGLVAATAVGMAMSGLVRSADAALPLAYAVLLPIAFISQVFFPAPTEAAWLHRLAAALPVAPFANAMESAFSASPHGLTASQCAVLATWAALAFLFAVIVYRWEPRRERRFGSRRSLANSTREVERATASGQGRIRSRNGIERSHHRKARWVERHHRAGTFHQDRRGPS
jgi:ABC-2 type transport system permease protein